MSNNNYNYPEITRGLGELTPSMWSRLMSMLRSYESGDENGLGEMSNAALHSRVTDLEMYKPFFFAKLLRAHVLDHNLFNPNVYEYAWVEVRPISVATDCCEGCLTSRNGPCTGPPNEECLPANILPCCQSIGNPECLTYLNYQGLWNWWENTDNTSWGNTLANAEIPYRFDTYDLTSDYNPLQYPCLKANASAPNCDPEGEGGYPNINTIAYTKPAMNILEAFNTNDQAGGVDQRNGIGDFMMQAIGGGDTMRSRSRGADGTYPDIPECHGDPDPNHPPCTQYEFALKSTPIVLMHNIRESGGTFRQVFQEANSYDGSCVEC